MGKFIGSLHDITDDIGEEKTTPNIISTAAALFSDYRPNAL